MALPSQVANVRWNLNPPPESGPHAYFDQWSADPRMVAAHSLRTQADLDFLAHEYNNSSSAAPGWVYDATKDAGKGTILSNYPSDADLVPQLWIKVPVVAGTATWVWDLYLPDSWSDDPVPYVAPLDGPISPGANRPGSGIPSKAYQVRRVSGSSGAIHMETRLFNQKNQLPNIAAIDWRTYGVLGPDASRTSTPNGNSSDTVQPLLTRFVVQANTWTRLIEHVEMAGLVSGGVPYDLWSLWAADTTRDMVQLYHQIPVQNQVAGLAHFDFEYDSSQQRAPGLPPESLYNRNVLMFKGITDPSILFAKPIG